MPDEPEIDPREKAAAERAVARLRREQVPPAYEYHAHFFSHHTSLDDMLPALNELGAAGWRLIEVLDGRRGVDLADPMQSQNSGAILVFERELK